MTPVAGDEDHESCCVRSDIAGGNGSSGIIDGCALRELKVVDDGGDSAQQRGNEGGEADCGSEEGGLTFDIGGEHDERADSVNEVGVLIDGEVERIFMYVKSLVVLYDEFLRRVSFGLVL